MQPPLGSRATAAAAAAVATAAAAAVATAAATAAAVATAAAAVATAAAAAVLTRLGLVDLERTVLNALAVEGLDRGLGGLVRAHLDEGEAAGAARLTVHHDVDVGHLAVLGEELPDVVLGGLERKVAAVDALTHG